MILYKLTDRDGYTRRGVTNELLWAPGVTHEAAEPAEAGTQLCTNQVIHAYRSLELGLFMNPIHANIADPRAWECDGDIVADDSTKAGVKRLTIIRDVQVPDITTEQRVKFGILAVRQVCHEPYWLAWADSWLSGNNRQVAAATWAARAAAAGAAMARAARAWVVAAGTAAAVAWAARRAEARAWDRIARAFLCAIEADGGCYSQSERNAAEQLARSKQMEDA